MVAPIEELTSDARTAKEILATGSDDTREALRLGPTTGNMERLPIPSEVAR
jgi:hypothetical protein